MPMVRQAILQGDDTKIDLSGSDEQVREYLFEDIKRQAEEATVMVVSLARWVESNDWSCTRVKESELPVRNFAISAISD